VKKFLSLKSERFKVDCNGYVGLDDRFWFRIVETRSFWGEKKYSIELILSRSNNAFADRESAIEFAKRCIADMHDLIKSEV